MKHIGFVLEDESLYICRHFLIIHVYIYIHCEQWHVVYHGGLHVFHLCILTWPF